MVGNAKVNGALHSASAFREAIGEFGQRFGCTDANGDRNACPLFHGTSHEVGKGV